MLMAEWLVLLTLGHEVPGSNLAGGGIQFSIVWCFIAQSFPLSPFHHLITTSLMLKFNYICLF